MLKTLHGWQAPIARFIGGDFTSFQRTPAYLFYCETYSAWSHEILILSRQTGWLEDLSAPFILVAYVQKS